MAKSKVLIVEDDEPLADVLQYNFEQEGFEVSRAADGMEALRKAQSASHDIIILDLMLPQLDGIEVCRQLRASAKTRDVLVIIVFLSKTVIQVQFTKTIAFWRLS